MTEKPWQLLVIHSNARRDTVRPIQLVSQDRYRKDISAKIRLLYMTAFFLLAGLVFLAASVWSSCQYPDFGCLFEFAAWIPIIILWNGWRFFVEAKQIKPVRPVIAHNAHRFLPKEILLRSSELPSSQQQVELLRAAQPGQETPPEELLRATQWNKDNEW